MHPQTRTFRPHLELLEDRVVPTNFVAEFPGFGVYRLTTAGLGSQALAQLTDLDAVDVGIAPNGDVLASIPPQFERSTGLFFSGGTVFFPGSGAPPIRVNFFTPNRLDISGLPGLPDSAVVSFQGVGVFLLDTLVGSPTFGSLRFLSPFTANDVAIAPNGLVAASFPPQVNPFSGSAFAGGVFNIIPSNPPVIIPAFVGSPQFLDITSNATTTNPTLVMSFPGFGTALLDPFTGFLVPLHSGTANDVTIGAIPGDTTSGSLGIPTSDANVFDSFNGLGILAAPPINVVSFFVPSAFDAQGG